MASNGEELGLRLWNLCDDKANVPSAAAVQSFITQGADINTANDYGRSVLMCTASNGYLDAAKELLAAEDIDIGVKVLFIGYTAFTYACNNGHPEIATLLLAAHKKLNPNFDINDYCVYHGGNTVLMGACQSSHVDAVKFLLSIPNINVQAKNDEGETALDHVKGRAKEDEMRALFQGELLPLLL
jgi:ankyrin repeat protein